MSVGCEGARARTERDRTRASEMGVHVRMGFNCGDEQT